MNETLNRLGVALHPDKTFIGRATRGFDFLGYAVSADCRVTPSAAACKNMIERITRLYEQGADSNRIGQLRRYSPVRWRSELFFFHSKGLMSSIPQPSKSVMLRVANDR